MGSIRISFRAALGVVSVLTLFGISCAAGAQRQSAPGLDEILERLGANLNHFDTSVPSFFCDEHVLSQVESDEGDRKTVTDSVFRLQRIANTDHTTTLEESRDVKSVNGKAASSQDIEGPSLLRGAFEGGLDVVSPNQKECMHYTLDPMRTNGSGEPYSIRFVTDRKAQKMASCLLGEKSSGRVLVDPASMQITHLEITTPHHTIIPGNSYARPVIGKRVLTVDYAPVVLGGETFWAPSTITMRSEGSMGSFRKTAWSYQASYRNYHRLEVKSRILPGGEAPAR